jgi:hypothetical protein
MTKYFLVAATILFLIEPANARRALDYRFGPPVSREDPALNNYLSARYDHLLQTSPRFRAYRMWKECHTINFSQALHDSCIASFDQYEPILPGYGFR